MYEKLYIIPKQLYIKDGEKNMFESLKLNEKGAFIIDGLNTFIVVAIMLAITVYLLYSITTATPVITAGVYNTTQASINTGIELCTQPCTYPVAHDHSSTCYCGSYVLHLWWTPVRYHPYNV